MNFFTQRKTVTTILSGLVIFFIEGFFFNQGVFAGLALAVVLISALILCTRRIFNKVDPTVFKESLSRKILFLFIAGASIAMIPVNAAISRSRAETVIAACEGYKQKNGVYPETLSALVPQFLPAVPNANLRLFMGEFFYMSTPEHHMLLYAVVPPFGRENYSFEERQWHSID